MAKFKKQSSHLVTLELIQFANQPFLSRQKNLFSSLQLWPAIERAKTSQTGQVKTHLHFIMGNCVWLSKIMQDYLGTAGCDV